MGEVLNLHAGEDGEAAAVCADLVSTLERLLAEAKTGRLIAIGYFTVDLSRDLETSWTGVGGQNQMVAGASLLQHRIVSATLDNGCEA